MSFDEMVQKYFDDEINEWTDPTWTETSPPYNGYPVEPVQEDGIGYENPDWVMDIVSRIRTNR